MCMISNTYGCIQEQYDDDCWLLQVGASFLMAHSTLDNTIRGLLGDVLSLYVEGNPHCNVHGKCGHLIVLC